MLNAPVQSLFNIFYYKDKNFTEHNRLYELIQSNFQKTKKSEIFILLQFIEGNLIEKENLIDSIRNEKDHFGFKPKFDLLSLFNRIQELEELNEIQIKRKST